MRRRTNKKLLTSISLGKEKWDMFVSCGKYNLNPIDSVLLYFFQLNSVAKYGEHRVKSIFNTLAISLWQTKSVYFCAGSQKRLHQGTQFFCLIGILLLWNFRFLYHGYRTRKRHAIERHKKVWFNWKRTTLVNKG